MNKVFLSAFQVVEVEMKQIKRTMTSCLEVINVWKICEDIVQKKKQKSDGCLAWTGDMEAERRRKIEHSLLPLFRMIWCWSWLGRNGSHVDRFTQSCYGWQIEKSFHAWEFGTYYIKGQVANVKGEFNRWRNYEDYIIKTNSEEDTTEGVALRYSLIKDEGSGEWCSTTDLNRPVSN